MARQSRAKLASDPPTTQMNFPSDVGVIVDWSGGGQAISLPFPGDPEHVLSRQGPFEDPEDCPVERGIDHGAPRAACLFCVPAVAPIERGQHRLRGEHPGEVVRDRHARSHGRTIGKARQIQEPPVGDPHAVQTGSIRIGSVLAEHADTGPDEPRIAVLWGNAPRLQRAGTEVLTHDVSGSGEPAKEGLSLIGTEVERDTLRTQPSQNRGHFASTYFEARDFAREAALR